MMRPAVLAGLGLALLVAACPPAVRAAGTRGAPTALGVTLAPDPANPSAPRMGDRR